MINILEHDIRETITFEKDFLFFKVDIFRDPKEYYYNVEIDQVDKIKGFSAGLRRSYKCHYVLNNTKDYEFMLDKATKQWIFDNENLCLKNGKELEIIPT